MGRNPQMTLASYTFFPRSTLLSSISGSLTQTDYSPTTSQPSPPPYEYHIRRIRSIKPHQISHPRHPLHADNTEGRMKSFGVLYIAKVRKDLSCVSETFRVGRRAHLAGHLSGWDYVLGVPIVDVFNASLFPLHADNQREPLEDVNGAGTEAPTTE
ncbi:hypothetical protein PCANC_18680 [Puccinia coronata f. sp. avenae]|uniref:Uncharacterized protein n=1 Tax=Puccinia coronata f. sp. avenae TaxID=200324 RepID=A0A2N5VCG7_9BASI|nr:hypothetical protein PCANC_18680 [Puccinia coronata f. sp. avenae]